MRRRPAKQTPVADWQITRIARKALYLGQVQAPDAATVIKPPIEKFDIPLPSTRPGLRRGRIMTAERPRASRSNP